MELIWLCCFALIAGFIDAIAGGGGLIQLPAYFIFMPHFSTASLFGSNKLGGFSGTFVSTIQYLKNVKAEWKLIWPSLIVAAAAALTGAQFVSLFDKDAVAPFVVILLMLMLVYTVTKKQSGMTDERHTVNPKKVAYILPLSALLIGLYDGFFGPGAGSMLMFVFITFLRYDFLHAAAHTKIFNCVTNIGALAFFICNGDVVYKVAIPVALCNVAGNYLGVKLALKKGSGLIKGIYILVVCSLIAKLVYDYIIT